MLDNVRVLVWPKSIVYLSSIAILEEEDHKENSLSKMYHGVLDMCYKACPFKVYLLSNSRCYLGRKRF